MQIRKGGTVAILGVSASAFGAWLRVAARDLAWPREWSYGGPRAESIWAIREQAYVDLSYALLIFGMAVFLVVLVKWLWTPAASER